MKIHAPQPGHFPKNGPDRFSDKQLSELEDALEKNTNLKSLDFDLIDEEYWGCADRDLGAYPCILRVKEPEVDCSHKGFLEIFRKWHAVAESGDSG